MKLINTLKEKFLSLYVLTFVTGTALYTTLLYADDIKNPDFKKTAIVYVCIVYVFLSGYIILKNYLARRVDSTTFETGQHPNEIISLQEVKELIRYAATHGIDKEKESSENVNQVSTDSGNNIKSEKNTIISELTQLATKWEQAEEHHEKLAVEDVTKIVLLYKDLNLFTPANVTGKTLCDSLKVDQVTQPIRHITWYLVFPLILLNVFLDGWFQDTVEPEEGLMFYLLSFQRYVLEYITPFLWGALGSCVYLLKVFSDLAENNVFTEDKLQGWGTRITLGAILGGVIQFIYDESAFGNSGLKLDANAIGFLAGVGVKVVYGALEKTIEKMSSFMNLDTIKKAKTDNNEIRRYLNEKISELGDGEEDKKKITLIQGFILDLNRPS